MIEGFLNPGLALGAALAAVPLVIHLLNRRRHVPLRWAGMRFVQAAHRRVRRRVQMENLLLLLLRMAAVALLALALGRPFTGRASPLAPLTESRRDVVLVVDASFSTGYRDGVESVFDGIVERARELLANLDGTRGDRVRLVVAGATPTVAATRTPEDALSLLATISEPRAEPLDLAAALGEVLRIARDVEAGGTAEIEVRLLTDAQRSSFLPRDATSSGAADEGEAPALFPVLDELRELGVTVLVEDLGPEPLDPPNAAVVEVAPVRPPVGAGVPVEIGVGVAGHGTGGPSSARLVLEVDGERRPARSVDLSRRGRAEVVVPVVFADGGDHVVTARLEGDRLRIDDARSTVVRVPRPLEVLLVDGEHGPRIEEAEVGFLRAVLEPPDEGAVAGFSPGARAPFVPRVVTERGLASGDLDLARYDVIVLANTLAPSQAVLERIEARVAAGAALMVTAGANLESDSAGWNARAFRADGSGLLPAEIGTRVEVPDRRSGYHRAASFDESHPALSFFADERWRPLLTEAPVYAFLRSRPLEYARVLIRLDDDARSPLLVEKAYDRGRVLLWTTTIDREWTRIPESPRTLVPLVHELFRHAARGDESVRNVRVGTPLSAEVESFPRGLAVVGPDGARRPLDGEPVQVADGLWRLPPVAPTDAPGPWRIEREDAPPLPFAVQLDPSESDLLRLAPDEIDGLHPALLSAGRIERGAAGADGQRDPRRGELWRWLAGLCLAALLGETLWSAWIGRRRAGR